MFGCRGQGQSISVDYVTGPEIGTTPPATGPAVP